MMFPHATTDRNIISSIVTLKHIDGAWVLHGMRLSGIF